MHKALWADDVLWLLAPWRRDAFKSKQTTKPGEHVENIAVSVRTSILFWQGRQSEEEENDYSAHSSNESRLVDTSWCSCERCVAMPKEIECICCKELVFLSKVVEGESINFTCI